MFPCNFTKQGCLLEEDCNAGDFQREEGEPESFQLQLEEVPVSQKSISAKNTVQGFVNVSELDSSICNLKSNSSFDRDITKERSSGTRSPSPHDLRRLQVAEPFSSFGFKPKPGGGIDLTQQKPLQTPALKKSDICVDAPASAPPLPPPPPRSSQTLMKGMKQADSSGVAPTPRLLFCSATRSVAPMQGFVFGSATRSVAPMQDSLFGSAAYSVAPMLGFGFGSATPIHTNSEKTNIEEQVSPQFPGFQASKKVLRRIKCKKKAVCQRDVTAPEEGFTEASQVVVSLRSVLFYI